MVRKEGAKRLRRIWRLSLGNHFFPLTIVVPLVLVILSCARGGGTPVSDNPEGGILDSATMQPTADTGIADPAAYCGNGKLEPENGEQCDLQELGQATCTSLSNGQEEGELGCNPDCTYNTIMCYPIIQGGTGGVAGYGG